MPPVFTPMAEVTEPYVLRIRYRTRTFRADDETEQRAQLRVIPVREELFAPQTLHPQPSGILDTLLTAPQGAPVLLPYWPHGTLLTAPVSPGAAVALPCDTSDREFVVGGQTLLWLNEWTYEVVTLTDVAPGALEAAAVVGTWPAGCPVLPLREASREADAEITRPGTTSARTRLAFTLALGTDPGVTTPAEPELFPLTYRKVDPADTARHLVDRVSNATFTFQDVPRRRTGLSDRTIRVWLPSRASVAELVTWFHGLKGSLTPFWLPTYQADLQVLEVAGPLITVRAIGYADAALAEPTNEGRRFLAFIVPGGAIVRRYVVDAEDNLDGTETLLLDDAPPAAFVLCSYLLYVRIADDTLEVRWLTGRAAECAIPVVEVSPELPAGVNPPEGSAS